MPTDPSRNGTRRLGAVLFALSLAAPLLAQQPAVSALLILPPTLRLDDDRDRPRVVALATTPSGLTVDVTDDAEWSIADPAVATAERVAGTRQVAGQRAGETSLQARFGGQFAVASVVVVAADAAPPVSFTNDVLPVLTRSGCNAGTCHGAAAGKNGFALSLFAYDGARDHLALTRELRGRRIDPADPAHSLLLQKGCGLVPHQGGKKLVAGSELHRLLQEWIAAGAADDAKDADPLVAIELLPGAAELLAGSPLRLQLLARYRSGRDRDVTGLALWSSSNDTVFAVDGHGLGAARTAGESTVLGRFGGLVATAQVLVLRDDQPIAWPALDERNFVDHHVHRKLRRARVLPAGLCSDAVFVRRVHLDLLGVLPTPAEARAFGDDPAPDKRERLIDALLERREFADWQAMQWAEVLRVDQERMEPKGAALLTRWLQQQFQGRRPFDAIVRDLLVAEGESFASPPANFWLVHNEPNLLAEHVAQNFLGIRVQCAQCHNHPFENWSMDDYYGFAAFFGQVGRKRAEDGAEWLVWDRRNGDVRNKRTNQVAAPRFLGGGLATIPANTDRRAVLAEWLTSKQNRAFAANIVNRLWAGLFGRGIVDPPDDVRISNPPSHPELLTALADHLVAADFDVRTVVRTICRSRTYQLARASADAAPPLFAGNHVRRLGAEQLHDAIAAVTGVPNQYPGVAPGGSAAALASGRANVRFLELFGRPSRESACTCDRSDDPNLGQTLHLINGDTVMQKIADRRGRLQQALASNQTDAAMLDDLFLAAYSRLPDDDERSRLLPAAEVTADAKQRAAHWQDLYWAVLNSREFLFQH